MKLKGDMNSLENDRIHDIQKRYQEFNNQCIQLLKVIENFKSSNDNTNIISAYEHHIISFLTPFFHYIGTPFEDEFLRSINTSIKRISSSKGWKHKLVSAIEKLNKLIHGNRKKSIYVNFNIAKITRIELIIQWFFKYRLILSDQFVRTPLSSVEKSTISELLNLVCDTFPDHIKPEFFDDFLSNLLVLNPKDGFKLTDYFVTGSNMNINSRLMAFYFQREEKKVISISHHNNGLLTFDEPWTIYAELAFVDTYIDHGNKELGIDKCNILQADVKVEETRNQRAVKYPNTLLYIPTSLSGFKNYGPFRAYSDEDYKIVQELLIENCTRLGIDLHIKQHPKQRTKFDTGDVLSRFEFLEEVIDEYEFILLDYISNASQLVISKNKTIFYLDFSIRKIHKSYLKDMESSLVGFYNIDSDNDLRIAFEKINSIIQNEDRPANNYSQLESYYKNGKDKIDVINEVI
jgi:hypothetical protein